MEKKESKKKRVSPRTQFEVLKRDGFSCQICGCKAPEAVLEIGYIIHIEEGGTDHISNLYTVCRKHKNITFTHLKTNQEGQTESNEHKRIPIPKKLRLQVFKRDNWTCQYTGKKPPEVKLVVDHIIPVAKGGTNDITNLITCSEECNIGKLDILLSDNTLLENQYKEVVKQSENTKRILDMCKLRDFYERNRDRQLRILEKRLLKEYRIKLDENSRKKIKMIIIKYGITQIFETFDSLYARDLNDEVNFDVFLKQLKLDIKLKEKPYLLDTFYIRKILINRFNIRNKITKGELLKYIEEKINSDNYDIDMLIRCAKDCWKLEQFYRLVEGNKPEGQAS